MQKNPTAIPVVAVALIGPDGLVLMQRRRFDQHHGGKWEFPGGKVEASETQIGALVREAREELGIAIAEADLGWVATAELPGERHVIALYSCRLWQDEPRCLEAAEIGWFAPADLAGLQMPPLDRPLASALKRAI